MHTIEQAIRHALQKIDTANPAMRNKLYQATWQTHEKMLDSIAHVTDEERQARREALKKIIQAIEAECSQPDRYQPPAHAQLQPQIHPQPIVADPQLAPTRFANRQDTEREKKSTGLRGNGFLLVLVGILLFVGWSFYTSIIGSYDPEDSSTPSPPATISSLINQSEAGGDTSPPRSQIPEPAATKNWIRIFDPANIEAVQIKGAAKVQLNEDEEGNFLRLQSRNPEDGISLEIGGGIMTQLAGKSAVFNIIARGTPDMITQLSVACDFGATAICGRWRFELPPAREDLLFGVDIPESIVPNAPATFALSVNGDVRDQEYVVDLFGVEVSFNE